MSYDANGNRLSSSAPGNAVALGYEAASNRMATLTVNAIPEAVSLDAAGNLLTLRNGDATLTYNGANRVAEVTHLGAPLVAYTYNYLGLRTRKTSSAGSLMYHYDQRGQLLMETTAAGVALRTYLWRDNAPLAQVTLTAAGPRLLTLHTDHLNTPRAASNAAGTVVWRWAGEAFGSTTPLEDPDGDAILTVINLRFPGQYFDAETGFFYNWHRYYDPRLGRYITSDPIGLDGGLNTYSYVFNNSLRWTDPSGLEVRFICRVVATRSNVYDAQHCFVYVTCPQEGWQRVFSLFGDDASKNLSLGYKHSYDPGNPSSNPDDGRDDPNGNNSFNEPVQCSDPRQCQCEKEIRDYFNRFPSGRVKYNYTGPNSNSFAADLIRNAPSCLGLPNNAPKDTLFGGAPGISQTNPGGFPSSSVR